jgi:cytochrome d ubiquinol oxidase subunit II
MLEILWFCLVAIMIAGYVVLDGFDLGAGIIHLFVARDDAERRIVLKSVGPVWDGNEVWLLAGGGTLYFAFPGLYASSFSGFYLPLMMVLWLLMIRGISIEFRNHIDSPTWKPVWDVGFAFASLLLAVFFGAALGNVVRGVPLDQNGDFFLPLWTNFLPGADPGILDWYTVLVGLLALATLTLHGARWVAYKTEGGLNVRTQALAGRVWWALAALTALTTIASFQLQPQIWSNFAAHPWGYIFPAIALVGLLGARFIRDELKAFLASGAFIVGMLTSAAFGVFPYVLPANNNTNFGLTIYNTAPAEYGLKVGLVWWIPGMILAGLYTTYVYRTFGGKVKLEESAGHY